MVVSVLLDIKGIKSYCQTSPEDALSVLKVPALPSETNSRRIFLCHVYTHTIDKGHADMEPGGPCVYGNTRLWILCDLWTVKHTALDTTWPTKSHAEDPERRWRMWHFFRAVFISMSCLLKDLSGHSSDCHSPTCVEVTLRRKSLCCFLEN